MITYNFQVGPHQLSYVANEEMSLNFKDADFFELLKTQKEGEYRNINAATYTDEQFLKFLKGHFRNFKQCEDLFISKWDGSSDNTNGSIHIGRTGLMKYIRENWATAKRFTYKEAFEIEDAPFRALVFSTINVPEMVNEMGYTRIATEGIRVKRKQYNAQGEFTGYKEYDNIYELLEVNGEKIGATGMLYAIKCWCTSTDKEHILWLEDDKYKTDPLEAIASTFRIHKNMIPYISVLKRQGDIMICELTEEGQNVTPEGEIVPLTKEQYFGLLVAES